MDIDGTVESIDVTPVISREAESPKADESLKSGTNFELNEGHQENNPMQISNDESTSVSNSTDDAPTTSNSLTVYKKNPFHEYRDKNIYDQIELSSECSSTATKSSDTDADYESPFEKNTSNQSKESIVNAIHNMCLFSRELSRENINEISAIAMPLRSIQGRRPSAEFRESNAMKTIDEEDSKKNEKHKLNEENQPPNKRQKFG